MDFRITRFQDFMDQFLFHESPHVNVWQQILGQMGGVLCSQGKGQDVLPSVAAEVALVGLRE